MTEHGRKAGLQVGDRILKVNGLEFTILKEYDAAHKKKVGDRNTYLLERSGKRFEANIENIPLYQGEDSRITLSILYAGTMRLPMPNGPEQECRPRQSGKKLRGEVFAMQNFPGGMRILRGEPPMGQSTRNTV